VPSAAPEAALAIGSSPLRIGLDADSRRPGRVHDGGVAQLDVSEPARAAVEAQPPRQPAIVVSQLVRSFGPVIAVAGISFEVAEGEVFGLLGPNGAGKSTTINVLCTLLRPTSGSARIAGLDVAREALRVRQQIGLVFQDTTLDDYLTAAENLRFHAELYGVEKGVCEQRLDSVLEMVGLEDRRDDLVGTFSGGMKRRLEIARGLIHSPRVLFLDEPTVGLDPQTRTHIWSYIGELRRREAVTIFLTTHYMEEAEHCDRIAIVDNGELVAIDSPDALKATIGEDRIELHVDDHDAAIAALRASFGIDAATSEGAVVFHVAGGEEFVPRLFAELAVPIRAIRVARPSLDDVFMAYTGRTIRDAEASAGERLRNHAMRWRGRR
jgi:ABC-2 type transport system ATP-binding protein